MPQVFKIGPYWVYFWSNENDPLEPEAMRLFTNGLIILAREAFTANLN